jgi:hypothetical protein
VLQVQVASGSGSGTKCQVQVQCKWQVASGVLQRVIEAPSRCIAVGTQVKWQVATTRLAPLPTAELRAAP